MLSLKFREEYNTGTTNKEETRVLELLHGNTMQQKPVLILFSPVLESIQLNKIVLVYSKINIVQIPFLGRGEWQR